jgi:hypothetical protein
VSRKPGDCFQSPTYVEEHRQEHSWYANGLRDSRLSDAIGGTETTEKRSSSVGKGEIRMRAAGGCLIAAAVILFLVGVGMDTSIQIYSGERVHNVGLVQQEIAIVASVGLFVGGVILFALGGRNGRPGSSPAAPSVGGEYPAFSNSCPYCHCDAVTLKAVGDWTLKKCRRGHYFSEKSVA